MRTMFRSSVDELPDAAAIRERRVEVARRNTRWTELRETGLVRRGRWLVHAETDELFKVCRGTIFLTGEAVIAFNDQVEMHFYVDRDGDIVFLQRDRGTWSDVVAKRAKRRAAA